MQMAIQAAMGQSKKIAIELKVADGKRIATAFAGHNLTAEALSCGTTFSRVPSQLSILRRLALASFRLS